MRRPRALPPVREPRVKSRAAASAAICWGRADLVLDDEVLGGARGPHVLLGALHHLRGQLPLREERLVQHLQQLDVRRERCGNTRAEGRVAERLPAGRASALDGSRSNWRV